ncbi:MAG: CZB domain-containing protein [Pseudomonadales bacterium]
MTSTISSSATSSFVETVKLDHILWKNSVYEGLLKQDFSLVQTLADHKSCRLGLWYLDSERNANFRGRPGFNELDRPHEQVHTQGRAALVAAQEGRNEEALEHLQAMESASLEVAGLLDKLKQA